MDIKNIGIFPKPRRFRKVIILIFLLFAGAAFAQPYSIAFDSLRVDKYGCVTNASGDTLARFYAGGVQLYGNDTKVLSIDNSGYLHYFNAGTGLEFFSNDANSVNWNNTYSNEDFKIGTGSGTQNGTLRMVGTALAQVRAYSQWIDFYPTRWPLDAMSAFAPADSGATPDTLYNFEECYGFSHTTTNVLYFVQHLTGYGIETDSIAIKVSTPDAAGDSTRFILQYAQIVENTTLSSITWYSVSPNSDYVDFETTATKTERLLFTPAPSIYFTDPEAKIIWKLKRDNSISNNVQDTVYIHDFYPFYLPYTL